MRGAGKKVKIILENFFSVLLNENSAREIFRSEMMQQKKGFEEMMRRRRWRPAE
jgi:hypothetical protein